MENKEEKHRHRTDFYSRAKYMKGEPEDKLLLDYNDLPEKCTVNMTIIWKLILQTESKKFTIKMAVLRHAIKQGVPLLLRAAIWRFLYNQWKTHHKHSQLTKSFPKVSFEQLLCSGKTAYKRAISLDLGRTFPNRLFFKFPFSDGKLALSKVLEAYSLVDKEVGYCQGLNFVAGFLLIHSYSDAHAFGLFMHIMFRMNFRKLFLPDLSAGMKRIVYQLNRLLRDFHGDLHKHFEEQKVSLMFFVPQWFITMFTTILPFNLTARFFDLLFLEDLPALFKMALCLLSHYKVKLLEKQGFENIVAYLRDQIAAMSDHEAIQILYEAFDLDVVDNLLAYEAEYALLDGEEARVNTQKSSAEELEKKYSQLFQTHQTVIKYNVKLMENLQAAQTQIASLYQGLTDMAKIYEKRTLQMDEFREENEVLKRSY